MPQLGYSQQGVGRYMLVGPVHLVVKHLSSMENVFKTKRFISTLSICIQTLNNFTKIPI